MRFRFWALLAFVVAVRAEGEPNAPDATSVEFRNGDVVLSGTLITPRSAGAHAAIVVLHGSGPATRDGGVAYGQEFARLGIATLAFDKRGSGKSSGDWTAASLEDLAGDARAAVGLLKSTPGIDPRRIGFFGVSQAGWVATVAAADNPDVAFMVLVSGGGVSPHDSEMYSYVTAFERAGLSDAETTEGVRMVDRYMSYLATGEGRDRLASDLIAAHGRKWYELAALDRILPSADNRLRWKWVATWDPAPQTARLHCPILLLFGDRDAEFPTAQAISRWREGARRAGNSNVKIVVFPGAGHGIRMRDGFSGPGRAPFADGYEEVIVGWLWRTVVDARR